MRRGDDGEGYGSVGRIGAVPMHMPCRVDFSEDGFRVIVCVRACVRVCVCACVRACGVRKRFGLVDRCLAHAHSNRRFLDVRNG